MLSLTGSIWIILKISLNLYVIFLGCLILALVTFYKVSQPADEKVFAALTAKRVHEQLRILEDDVLCFLETDSSCIEQTYQYPFFVFENSQLIYWTSNAFVPSAISVSDTFEIKLIKGNNSDFLARKWIINKNRFVVGLIPLYRQYAIANDYLGPEWNNQIFVDDVAVAILEINDPKGIAVCVGENDCPFKVSVSAAKIPLSMFQQTLVFFLFFLTIALGVWVLFRQLRFVPYYEVRFLLLYGLLLVVRTLMVRSGIPSKFITSDVFDPKLFASSPLNASLGDLVLNTIAIFILGYYLFRYYHRFHVLHLAVRHRFVSWLLTFFAALSVLFTSLFPFVVIQTIYNNSSIDLDVTQSLHFDTPRMFAYVVVVVSGISTFFFMHAFLRILMIGKNRIQILISGGLAAIVFVSINLSTGQEFISSLVGVCCYLLVVVALGLYSGLGRLTFQTFAYLFVAIFFISVNGAVAIHYFTKQDRVENLFRFAQNFLVDRDDFGEYLLAEMARNVSGDKFIQSRIQTPFFDKEVVRQKIRQFFLPGYFNKYDVEIMLFNSAGEPIDNRVTTSFSDVVSQYDQDAFRTQHEHVYFNRRPSRDVAQQYLVVMPVARAGKTVGYVLMELSLKKVIPESVYPELLVDNRFQQVYRTQDISYAVFAGGKLQYSAGIFSYEKDFDLKSLGESAIYTSGVTLAGFDHIAQEDDHTRVAVVSSPRIPLSFMIANFSYQMVMGLMIVLLLILFQGAINIFRGHTLLLTARIQLLMNMAFFIPLVTVSVVTLSLMSKASEEQLTVEYLNKAKAVGEQLEWHYQLDQDTLQKVNIDSRVSSIAKLARVDLNIYDATGFMLATSQPLIVENGLISRYISPTAWNRIRAGDLLFVETSAVGKLEYDVSYAGLRSSSSGTLTGVLAIPFFRSGVALERAQISLLVNILNIFILIFIVLVVLAYWVSRWLTFPLSFITQSLKRTSLMRTNQPLVWKADDEIGMMVKEYNQMLYNLSESKAELEQTQRERTWREIAQQVAHEIKNPLTPMKLTLQQLERTLKGGSLSSEKAEKSVTSLLTQVDTLNEIASSFSTFAKMPEPVMNEVDINTLLQRIIDLHSQGGSIRYQPHDQSLTVLGDEQFLGRTFSNIILNAFQAERPGENLIVYVSAAVHENVVRISFKDNGKGMTPDIAERVFFPHFTTKKSGSGLGMAIAKQAIEHMQGSIWFETQEGAGTCFFIELPLRPLTSNH